MHHYFIPCIILFSTIIVTPFFIEISAQESTSIQLLPTDDAIVITDLSDPDDPVNNLNVGEQEQMPIGYSFNSTNVNPNLVSLGYLKFELSDVDNIASASLNLNILGGSIQNNTLVIFKANSNDWSESTLSFANKPTFFNIPIDTVSEISSTNMVQWDVTNAIKQNNSTTITFVITLNEFKQNSNEEIIFYSKESLDSKTHPFLELTFEDSTLEQSSENYLIKKLPVTEDAYVGANYADLQGFEEMRNINTGNFNFTKIWYAYNSTSTGEFLISSGYLKFDLSELNHANVIDAQLKMYNTLVTTSGSDRLISVFLVDNSTWYETTLTFDNKPELVKKIAIAQIGDGNDWISWNVTDAIKESNSSELTLSIIYDIFRIDHEEQTIFNSKESLENTPYLEIVYDEPNNGGGCLIATAAYGSEMAPQVQQLRELRDNHLLQTSSGTAFMTLFNSLYYSFSPTIADLQRENPVFQETVKLLITPLISSLSILNHVVLDSESAVLGYGLSIIALNVGFYFVSPFIGFKIVKILVFRRSKIHN